MITEPESAARPVVSGAVPPVQVVLNPTARSGAAAAVRAELERELGRRGIAWQRMETSHPGHAAELAYAAARAGAGVVVAVGGDGTVHEVANGLLRAHAEQVHTTALGIVPCGTGNDFARIVAGIRNRTDAYDALRDGRMRDVDAGLVRWDGGEEYFVNGMGTGIDVEVVRQLRKTSRLPGALIYLSAVFRALRRFRPVPLRLSANGETIDSRAMMAAVCNGRRIGGGFRICPESLADDGLLDACFVEALAWHEVPAMLLGIVRGTHTHRPRVRMLRAATYVLEVPAGTPLFVQLDGELREAGEARVLRVTTLPRVLRVVAAPVTEG